MHSSKLGFAVGMFAMWCAACGGQVNLPSPGDAGAGGAAAGGTSVGGAGAGGKGSMGTGGTNDGAGGCPPLPTEPQYDCMPRLKQPTDCEPSGSSGAGNIGYPQGCVVTLPRQSGFSPCGPQTCNCSMFPNADGTSKASWICPL